MKKTLPIFSLIVFLLTSCGVVDNPVEDITSIKIKTETKYKINLSNQSEKQILYKKNYSRDQKIIDYTEYFPNGGIKFYSEFTYEKTKTTEEQKRFDENGILLGTSRVLSVVDENGKIKEKTQISGDDKIISKEIYTYDVYGNLLRKEVQNLQVGTVLHYEYAYLYNNGSLIERTVSEKNSSETIITKESLNYKQEEKALQIINYDKNGSIQRIRTFYYNRYGLISIETVADLNGNLLEKYQYSYIYY
ncbi:MAG TPA: hypothetical protein PLU67_03860 [Candidatus Kapabacteria bacterium]|jgi:hypothetical protein|nr:hypothetical protein [Candidatus Kapabacteria bacterium]HOM04613.1 hypothetical protein [Candidatus Kapabacteria bacterium]HPP40234.1 hypothetical protein [Candidatus Kapabacteria bacterium]